MKVTGAARVKEIADSVIDENMGFYSGNRESVKKLFACVIAGGHVLIEDKPGVGKTFLAKVMARSLGITFNRIQFTPDLLPSDIIGTKMWRQSEARFEVVLGPIFASLVLADEINRAPPKTQAALLEAMEELQVTIEGETHQLPRPFLVIATQNPIEFEGTYPLPEAEMDRFMLKMNLGYPTEELERQLLERRIMWKTDDPSSQVTPVTSADEIIAVRSYVESSVHVDPDILRYILSFRRVRDDKRVVAGPSPRALMSLLRMSRSIAAIEGRDYVVPDDVKEVAVEVLGHRIVLKPELALEGEVTGSSIVEEFLEEIAVPK
ncbi:MAG: AAA family ATPase [Thermoprotei archaeon]